MDWIRSLVISNWRNKAVALFFAVSIWFVAYQSETRPYTASMLVRFRASDPEKLAITGIQVKEGESYLPFQGQLRLNFSGPRKQIEQLKDNLRKEVVLTAPLDREIFAFSQGHFDFPRSGVEIVRIDPPEVRLLQEEFTELVIRDLKERIAVTEFGPGFDVVKEVLEPKPGPIRLRVPKSLAEKASVRVHVPMGYQHYKVDGYYDLKVTPEEDELLQRTAQIGIDGKWFGAQKPPRLRISVQLTASSESFSHAAVRITFRVPLIDTPYQIVLNDIPGDSIPVEFYGPSDQVERLRKKLSEQPSFSLVVPVPSNFDPEKNRTFTFTEDSLELYGFPDIRIRQHESRKRDFRSAWSYEVRTFPQRAGGEE
jgi:hypothetical protein